MAGGYQNDTVTSADIAHGNVCKSVYYGSGSSSCPSGFIVVARLSTAGNLDLSNPAGPDSGYMVCCFNGGNDF